MKKMIFCFDGTSNDPEDAGNFFHDSSISNVLKIHAMLGGSLLSKNLSDACVKGQLSFYYSGVGTRGGWLRKILNAALSPTYLDMEDILAEAKKDLRKYNQGDEIYIFGFSRGAAIARIFAAKHIGNHKVKFLGLFDTVAAIKGSLDLKRDTFPASDILFENCTLGRSVERALHLVSIDEKRLAFQPTLFNKDKKQISEVWFAGVHSDIGGGYWFDGLPDITLQYMINIAGQEGLSFLKPHQIKYSSLKDTDKEYTGEEDVICKDDIAVLPLPNGVMHEQVRSGLSAKTLAPRLVRVNVKDKPSKDTPILHYTVAERFQKVPEYRPYALRNRRFQIQNSAGELSSSILGIEGLRKYELEAN